MHERFIRKAELFQIASVFIFGTVIGISRPEGNIAQAVIYNGQKRKQAVTFRAVVAPEWLQIHVAGLFV